MVYAKVNEAKCGSYTGSYPPLNASIVKINFNNGTYEFIDGKQLGSQEIKHSAFYSTPDTVMLVGYITRRGERPQHQINIFKLNAGLSKFENYRKINIQSNYNHFHMIDGQIVFLDVSNRHDMTIVRSLIYIDSSENFITMENTGACLRAGVLSEAINVGYVKF
jgi:hypothetical protein